MKKSMENGGILQAILIMLLFSGLCVLLQAFVQSTDDSFAALSVTVMPFIMLCNVLPLFLAMCVIYCVSNRVWLSCTIVSSAFFVLLSVNYFKTYFRAETLSVFDFTLVTEAADIMTGYTFPIPIMLIVSVVVIVSAIVFVCRNVKNTETPIGKRAALFGICAALGIAGYFTIYNGTGIYDSLPSFSNSYDDLSVAANKGFLYTFLSHTMQTEYTAPEGYSEEIAEDITGDVPDKINVSDMDKPVNVIAIMSEAFFDMEACENVQWYEGMNPTPNLDRLREDSLWGYISVPGFAGSTASTEFEFLTGINISLIDSSMPVVYKTHVTKKAYSLVRLFKDYGYTALAMHPGEEWFYNRKAVYPRLGFDEAIFKDGFDYGSDDLINYYISDNVTAQKINSEYDDYLKNGDGNGYFSFTVTIQNHGPYSTKKPSNYRLIRTDAMDDAEYNILSNYANGLYDADALLGEVCDFAENTDAPTVVVFFGDHLPFLDSESEYLTDLGYDVTSGTPSAVQNRYYTPYIIHGNSAFKEYAKTVKNGNGGNISSSFLAARLLDYMNLQPSPYFKKIGEISDSIQSISGSFYVEDGEYVQRTSTTENELLTEYKYLSYWALRGYEKQHRKDG